MTIGIDFNTSLKWPFKYLMAWNLPNLSRVAMNHQPTIQNYLKAPGNSKKTRVSFTQETDLPHQEVGAEVGALETSTCRC